MFEHHKDPLLPFAAFIIRVLKSFSLAFIFVLFSLALGAIGYHFTEGLPWLDALLNAAMILSGMGPVDTLSTASGKLFATFYALYSGIAFLTTIAILFAPIIHRFLHSLHVAK